MIGEARLHGDDSTRLLLLEEFEDLSSMSHLVVGMVDGRIGDGYRLLCSRHDDCIRGTIYRRSVGTVLAFVAYGGRRGRADARQWARDEIYFTFAKRCKIAKPLICPSLWVMASSSEMPEWWLSYLARLLFCLRLDVMQRQRA